MTTKLADAKGRVALGPRFANQTVIVDEVDPTREVRVTLAAVLHGGELAQRNAKAKASVLRGLDQARQGKLAKKPRTWTVTLPSPKGSRLTCSFFTGRTRPNSPTATSRRPRRKASPAGRGKQKPSRARRRGAL